MPSRSPRILLSCAWLVVAACAPVEVRSPSGYDNLRPARWVLTHPDLAMNGGPSAKLTYVGGSFGFIASGTFDGHLGLGTRIQSSPATYECRDNLPIDAPSHDNYIADTPSCRSGHRLRTEYPTWSFIAAF